VSERSLGDAPADEEIDLLMALVRQRYGDRLTAAELEGVRGGLASIVKLARALRAVRLGNGEEPYPPFVPFREP
jgi:hypothetical protein